MTTAFTNSRCIAIKGRKSRLFDVRGSIHMNDMKTHTLLYFSFSLSLVLLVSLCWRNNTHNNQTQTCPSPSPSSAEIVRTPNIQIYVMKVLCAGARATTKLCICGAEQLDISKRLGKSAWGNGLGSIANLICIALRVLACSSPHTFTT